MEPVPASQRSGSGSRSRIVRLGSPTRGDRHLDRGSSSRAAMENLAFRFSRLPRPKLVEQRSRTNAPHAAEPPTAPATRPSKSFPAPPSGHTARDDKQSPSTPSHRSQTPLAN